MKSNIAHRLLLILLLMAGSEVLRAEFNNANKELAARLEEVFSNLDETIKSRSNNIAQLKAERKQTAKSEKRVSLTDRLGDMYIDVNPDSAFIFWSLAKREAHELELNDFEKRLDLKITSYYPLKGLAFEAYDHFQNLDPKSLSPEIRKEYWSGLARINWLLMSYYPTSEETGKYRHSLKIALDSLANYYEPNSPEAGFIAASRQMMQPDKTIGIASYRELLPSFPERSEIQRLALNYIAAYYKDKPQYEQAYAGSIFKLALLSLEQGYVLPRYLAESGKLLYDNGHRAAGRDMMLRAMKETDKSSGQFRSFDHSQYTHYLAAKAVKTRSIIAIVISIIFLALLIICIANLIERRRYKSTLALCHERIGSLESELQDMSRVAESVMALSFITREQLQDYNLYVIRKLKAGQAKDLFNDLEKGTYLESQKEKFFLSFDRVVLEHFPDFLTRLNALFIPGKELCLLPGDRLSPELRIAAYMRFGITDTAMLARALGLSINTIYTYRNRLKGRAADRANFEENVRNLNHTPK